MEFNHILCALWPLIFRNRYLHLSCYVHSNIYTTITPHILKVDGVCDVRKREKNLFFTKHSEIMAKTEA